MASIRGKSATVPLRTPNLNDVWITYTARAKTKTSARARMLIANPHKPYPYPEMHCLAYAVIGQAAKDALPEKERGPKRRIGPTTICRQYQALIWLCSDDPDLRFWAKLADYPTCRLRQTFAPKLAEFLKAHPYYQQPANPTTPNSLCA